MDGVAAPRSRCDTGSAAVGWPDSDRSGIAPWRGDLEGAGVASAEVTSPLIDTSFTGRGVPQLPQNLPTAGLSCRQEEQVQSEFTGRGGD